jgi:hypothetical protein
MATLAGSVVPLAPVAQRIEHRPPEPVAQVRVLPGARGALVAETAEPASPSATYQVRHQEHYRFRSVMGTWLAPIDLRSS